MRKRMTMRDLMVRKADRSSLASEPVSVSKGQPITFDEFIGQKAAIAQLSLMATAAKARHEPIDHMLMIGPGGLGKSTLAYMIAHEMGAPLIATTATTLSANALGKILSTLKPFTALLIDEFHALSKGAVLTLYGAMQDGLVDIDTPTGPQRRKVAPFTLIGATTNPGDLTESMKDRFGFTVELTYYDSDDMASIALGSAKGLELDLDTSAAIDIADRSRGIPRVMNQYLRRIRDFAQVKGLPVITEAVADNAFAFFGVDSLGLTQLDRSYLIELVKHFRGGPVGGENLAVSLGVDYKTVANDIEPYLMRLGLVSRANRGRVSSEDARDYVRELTGEIEDMQ